MKTLVLIVIVLAAATQARHQSPRELLDARRPLTSVETATILAASQSALTAKQFRLSSLGLGGGPEVLMGPAGQPTIIRWVLEGGIVGGVVFPDGTVTRAEETHSRRIALTSTRAVRPVAATDRLNKVSSSWSTRSTARESGGPRLHAGEMPAILEVRDSRRYSKCCKVAGL